MKKINIYIIIILTLLSMIGCKKEEIIVKKYYLNEAFSIVPEITLMDKKDKISNLNIENELNSIIKNLDLKFNVFDENSLISKLNNYSGVKEITVDDEFLYIVQEAINISSVTTFSEKTKYDISIYSVWKEWNFRENYYQFYNYVNPPNRNIIKQKLPLVNYENIIIDYHNKTIFLKEKGMAIDLGSIVKGYAADKIATYLKSINIDNALINIGGNIVTLGKNIGSNKSWKVGILMPFSYNTEIGYIEANSEKETFVTSGIYQRYILSKNLETGEEKMYHHILNPLTGYPEDNELLSVTIVTTNSLMADGFSTAIFLMGLDNGLEYVNKSDNISAIFITKNKEIVISNNIKNRFIINENIYNDGYKLIN